MSFVPTFPIQHLYSRLFPTHHRAHLKRIITLLLRRRLDPPRRPQQPRLRSRRNQPGKDGSRNVCEGDEQESGVGWDGRSCYFANVSLSPPFNRCLCFACLPDTDVESLSYAGYRPYEALCLGVPFINPIKEWDPTQPENRDRWLSQHNGLHELSPPHVYHIVRLSLTVHPSSFPSLLLFSSVDLTIRSSSMICFHVYLSISSSGTTSTL